MPLFSLSRVRLNRGGYDSTGRYWGTGQPLYNYTAEYPVVYTCDTCGVVLTHGRCACGGVVRRDYPDVQGEVRADSRSDAITQIRAKYPDATFRKVTDKPAQPDPIRTWRKAGFTLRLWDTGRVDSTGHTALRYELRDGRRVIFAGDFGCPSCTAIDSLECVKSILGFLTLRDGDVDAEYFVGYTQAQLDWRDSTRCDQLAMIQFEMEERLEKRK